LGVQTRGHRENYHRQAQKLQTGFHDSCSFLGVVFEVRSLLNAGLSSTTELYIRVCLLSNLYYEHVMPGGCERC
jgi:hypothetical protein